jgi:DNA-binding FadR family transcriptional regulator
VSIPPRVLPMPACNRATRIASLIQEDIMRAGSAAGTLIGSERVLSQLYEAGRGTIREAARILACRGVAHMRPGPNGGLVVAEPDSRLVCQSFCGRALLAGAQAVDIAEARAAMNRVAACETGPVVDLLAACLYALDQHVAEDGRLAPTPGILEWMAFGRHRAGQIARKVIARILQQRGAPGLRLGTEMDLCRRYSTSRAIARQVVRLLEDAGLVKCHRGRGLGLFVTLPQDQSPLRTLSVYLQLRGVSASTSWRVSRLLAVECARLATANPVLSLMLESLGSHPQYASPQLQRVVPRSNAGRPSYTRARHTSSATRVPAG